jgi:hypothetical protein
VKGARSSAECRAAWLRGLPALLVGVCLTHAAPAAAEGEVLSAVVDCPRRATPGRIVCEVELEVARGYLAWGDVLVLRAPGFAPPLRSRLGSSAVIMRHERRMRLRLALAATSAGEGRLRVRARAVSCLHKRGEQLEHCLPLRGEAEASVSVGPITDPRSAGP